MRIWWCAQQESTVPWGLRECVRADDRETRMPGHEKCGPMRLIPDSEETVDREALAAALEDADYRLEQGNSISPPYVDRTLLALAAAARTYLALVGETP